MGQVAVNQVHYVDGLKLHVRAQRGHAGIAAQLGRQFVNQVGQRLLQIYVGRKHVSVHARAA